MTTFPFTPDLREQFPRLAKAPIVEAVIHWQARAETKFDQETLKSTLANEFQGYTSRSAIRHFGVTAEVSTDSRRPVVTREENWEGFRLKSDDEKHVIQFTRDGLAFSRTNGYDHWEPFVRDAKNAWRTYLRIAAPVEIQRLGIRFINQIEVATPENIKEYLVEPPTCPENLQLKEFVYQSTLAVPQQPFGIRLIKVMQPTMPELQKSSGLFLDIDVFTNGAISTDEAAVDDTLAKMRWLKNKVFFTLVTAKSVELFGGDK